MNSDKERQGLEFLDRLISKQIKSEKNACTPNLPCPDENTFGAFLENDLSDKEKKELEAHLTACVTCQAQMAGLLKILAFEAIEINPSQKPSPAGPRRWFGIIPHGLLGELGLAHAFSAILIMGVLIYSSVNLLKYGDISELSRPIALESKMVAEGEESLKATEQGDALKEKDASALHYKQARSTSSLSSMGSTDRPAQNLSRQDAAFGKAKVETARKLARDKAARPYADALSSGAGTATGGLYESAPAAQPAPPVPPASAALTEHQGDLSEPSAKPQAPSERPFFDSTGATLKTYVSTAFKEIEEDLKNQIARRLDALGIPRDRGRSMAQAEGTKTNAQQIPFSAGRLEAKAPGAKKEFLFVDGLWVDKEILQTPNRPVKWIKLESEEYKKLAAEQGGFKGYLLENREYKKPLADEEDLKRYITLGEKVLLIHQNQIYYIYVTKQ